MSPNMSSCRTNMPEVPRSAPVAECATLSRLDKLQKSHRQECLCYFLRETPSKILLATGWPPLNAGMNFQVVVDFKRASSTD
jgi:hypothetical protein